MGFHLSFLIAVMGTSYDGIQANSSVLNVWYPFIIYLIGFVVFSMMHKDRKALFFYVLLSVISLTLVLPLSKLTGYMLSLWPLLICNFCFEFFQMNAIRIRWIVTNIVAIATGVFIFSQLVFNVSVYHLFVLPQLNPVWFAHLATITSLFFILCSLFISSLPKNNVIAGEISKPFTCVLTMSICSYVVLYMLNIVTDKALFQSLHMIYTFILLPITFACTLLQDESVSVYYELRDMMTLGAIIVIVFCANILFLRFFLYLEDEEIVLILLLVIFSVYFAKNATGIVSSDKVDNLNESLYENRKLEFLYQFRFQKLLHNYVVFMLHQLKHNGYKDTFICLRRHGKIELFDENSLVSIAVITNYFDRIIATDGDEFVIDGKTYWIFQFLNRSQVNGFLAVQKASRLSEVLVSAVEEYITLLEQIYDLEILQQHYKSLPVIRLPDVATRKYQYEIRRMQEDESEYLHDVVLPKMFTIKNFLELIEVRHAKSKEYVLLEIKELNAALISHMYDLYPFTLKTLSLYEAIAELIIRLRNTAAYKQHAPQVHLIMNKTLHVPRYFFYPIYSFIRQVLSYIFTSEATRIDIYVSIRHNQIIIKVVDNGQRKVRQAQEDEEHNERKKISIINYEVKELGGKISTALNYPAGSTIVIQLPYKEEVNRWR